MPKVVVLWVALAGAGTAKGADAEVGAWQSIGLADENKISSVVAEMRRAIRNIAYGRFFINEAYLFAFDFLRIAVSQLSFLIIWRKKP